MNKTISFLVSAIFAAIVAGIVANRNDIPFADILTPALIYWFLIWKFLHDKRKDV